MHLQTWRTDTCSMLRPTLELKNKHLYIQVTVTGKWWSLYEGNVDTDILATYVFRHHAPDGPWCLCARPLLKTFHKAFCAVKDIKMLPSIQS